MHSVFVEDKERKSGFKSHHISQKGLSMILKVLTDNHPTLLSISDPVTVFDDDLKRLSDDMRETMRAYRGIGLAAPQVGVLKRLIVVLIKGQPVVMVNPEIVSKSGFYVSKEGCLSVPNRQVTKTRSKSVKVSYQDLTGSHQSLSLNTLEAACVQHEIDHLNGILIA